MYPCSLFCKTFGETDKIESSLGKAVMKTLDPSVFGLFKWRAVFGTLATVIGGNWKSLFTSVK